MAEDMSRYKDDFISETKEHLQILNTSLLTLEKDPKHRESIDTIFRGAHTIKGMAAAMGYTNVEKLCHTTEDLLDTVRNNKLTLNKAIIQLLFDAFDALNDAVKRIKADKPEPDTSALVSKLQQMAASSQEGTQKKEVKKDIPLGAELAKQPEKIEKIESIKIDVERLDILMNLIEELLVNKMMLDRIQDTKTFDELSPALDALARLVSDLQYNIMSARLVPVGYVFNRFPRMVRDLAVAEKKEIDFVMEGTDIELDRTIIDQIGEPLVHLLRNAVDHGIELPSVRLENKKPKQGKITLTARRERGYAIIEVKDDGKGLDPNKIREVAVKKGLYSKEEAAALNEEQVKMILFDPRFSMAEKVTKVSGRGVGMDVVKRNIEALGGNIKIDSQPGKGMKVTLELPLTLAIIKALLIQVGPETYALPLTNVMRSIRVPKENIKGMFGNEVVVLPTEEIPLIRLHKRFNIPEEKKQEGALVVIVRKGDALAGLAVDSVVSEQEIIIKPMNQLIKKRKEFAGFTILGTGRVVLILDVNNLV